MSNMSKSRIQRVAEVYDKLSSTWDTKSRFIKNISGGESNRGLKLIDSIVTNGMTIIDLGAGTGRATSRALRVSQDITMYSADISSKMLNKLQHNVIKEFPNFDNLNVIKSDVDTVEISKKADLIMMFYLLHHVKDAVKTLSHAASLLAKDGVILVQVPGIKECATQIKPCTTDHSKDKMGRFTLKELIDIGFKAGLEPIMKYDDNFVFTFNSDTDTKMFLEENSLLARTDNYNSTNSNESKFNGVKSIDGEYLTIVFKKISSINEENKNNKLAYKDWSNFYSKYALKKISNRGYSYDSLAKILFEESQVEDRGSLLDVGCGTGLVDKRIKSEHPNVNIYGIDLSSDMLAKNICKKDYTGLYLGDAITVPFSENYFDGIISSFMMHHSNNVPALVHKLYQLLSEGGYLAFVDFVLIDPNHFDKKYQSEVREYGATTNHFTISEMIRWLKGAGFVDIKYKQIGEKRDLPHVMFVASK